MAKKIVWQPEAIDDNTSRVKVLGGWLVNTAATTNKGSVAISSIFIQDQYWEWEPIEPYVDPQIQKANVAKDFATSN